MIPFSPGRLSPVRDVDPLGGNCPEAECQNQTLRMRYIGTYQGNPPRTREAHRELQCAHHLDEPSHWSEIARILEMLLASRDQMKPAPQMSWEFALQLGKEGWGLEGAAQSLKSRNLCDGIRSDQRSARGQSQYEHDESCVNKTRSASARNRKQVREQIADLVQEIHEASWLLCSANNVLLRTTPWIKTDHLHTTDCILPASHTTRSITCPLSPQTKQTSGAPCLRRCTACVYYNMIFWGRGQVSIVTVTASSSSAAHASALQVGMILFVGDHNLNLSSLRLGVAVGVEDLPVRAS
eukprot:2627037-Rhodomonas_salina.3